MRGIDHCGKAVGTHVGIYRNAEGRVRESGVFSCGRLWLCPVCSALRKFKRASEVEVAAGAWAAQGGLLLMLTLTARHDATMPLRDSLESVLGSWRALQGRTSFRALRPLLKGTIKALEITDGENGWHPHLHVLLFIPAGHKDAAYALAAGLSDDWRALVGSRLGATPSVERALHVKWLDASAAAYVSKIGKEIALSDTKSGRDPFALLDVTGVGAQAAGARFIEYGVATKGKHSLVWSTGLREFFELGALDDKSAAEELQKAEDGEASVLEWFGFIPRDVHTRLVLDGSIDSVLVRIGSGWWDDRWPRVLRDE